MTQRERGRLDGWYNRVANPRGSEHERSEYTSGYAEGVKHQELVRQQARRTGGQ